MYCKHCGAEIDDNAVVCPKCGVAVGRQVANDDAPSAGFAVMCFFLPIVGLILYLMWNETSPQKARSCGKGAIIGVIVSVVLGVIMGIAYSCLLNDITSNYPYY